MLAEHFKSKRKPVPLKNTIKVDKDAEKIKKSKQKKKKRLIIRNLSFKIDENELKEIFSKFGNVIEVKIPLKADGKKKGFGFIEYDNTKSLIQAMKSMNYQEIKGRKVAVDFAVDKTTYQLKLQSLKQESKNIPSVKNEKNPEEHIPEVKSEMDSQDESESEGDEKEDEEEDEDEKRLNAFLKEFDSGAEALTGSKLHDDDADSTSSDESDSENDHGSTSDEEENAFTNKKTKRKFDETEESPSKKSKKDSHDVSEGKTVFMRNLSFETTQESLRTVMEEYGECFYCLLCMDQFTDHPKGTAFVKFKEKSSADKLVEESANEPGLIVDGRKLTCTYAISRDEVSRLGEDTKKPKDKRNLNLLRVGLIMSNSKESEGVSASDMARRVQLEIMKKQKLKNVNFFVSDKRLMIHNLPRIYSDAELRKLFKNAAGKGAIITEARIMKEFSKTDAQGNPVSKGFGFVSFTKHEDALKALNELNNNPDIFTSQKRPIVEFSIENKVALLSKERKKEKIKMRNKRRTEEKKERQLQQQNEKALETAGQNETPSKKKRRKKKKKTPEKNMVENNSQKDEILLNKQISSNEMNSPKNNQKKKGKRARKERKEAKKGSEQADTFDLINRFKDDLKNKIT